MPSIVVTGDNESPAGLQVLCICNREMQDVLCSSCGFCFVGRVRKKCPVHQTAILLMDSACCPKCQTTRLIEIRSSTSPPKKPDNSFEEELSVLRQRRLSESSLKSAEARSSPTGGFDNSMARSSGFGQQFGKSLKPFTVHSTGKLADRFSGVQPIQCIQGSIREPETQRGQKGSQLMMQGLGRAARRRLLEWESSSDQFNTEMCFGDRRY